MHELHTRILEPLGLRHTYLPVHGERRLRGGTRTHTCAWAVDLTATYRALVRGRLLRLVAEPGRACFSVAFESTRLPTGVTIWGKSGPVPGYAAAIFGTRDLERTLAYGLTATASGAEGSRLGRIVAATYAPEMLHETH